TQALPLGGQLALLRQQLLLLGQQFFLGFRQLVGLLFELPGLFLSLTEQLLRFQIALENLEAHRCDRQKLLEQSLLARVEGVEGSNLQNAQQRLFRQQRQCDSLNRGSSTESGCNPKVVWRQTGQRNLPTLLRALSDQSLA